MRTVWRAIAGVLLALRGSRRRREREAERQAESIRRLRRGEELNAEAQRAADAGRRGQVAELAKELEETHEGVRRRRAEPPPTVSRKVVATPAATLQVVLCLLVSMVGAVAFAALYVFYDNTQLMGLSIGLMLIGFATACVIAGKRLVPQEKVVSEYHWFGDEESHADVEEILTEAGEGISRRRLLLGAAGAAGMTAAGAAVVPLASLGPKLDDRLATTPWRAGLAVVKDDGTPLRADEVQEGALVLGLPEGSDPRRRLGDSINVMRFPLDQLDLPADRKAKCPEGIVAYSRICTHAGCAVSMYRAPLFSDTEPSPALVCPCHYSTFDPRRGCAVDFGPAGRPLPQLPLRINAAGELEADGGFYEPPGPSYSLAREQEGRDS